MASRQHRSNEEIADQLVEMAAIVRAAGGESFRARAFERAAATVRGRTEPVARLLEREGRAGLVALPTIGVGIARRIESIAFEDVGGRGEQLAMFDAPASAEPPRRAARDLFESQIPPPPDARPPIGLLLRIDGQFREQAGRSDPVAGQWTATWRLTKGSWDFVVRFSDSKSARQMGRTRDWVVVEWERGDERDQATIVSEYRGPLTGRRVVRGRERECLSWWSEETRRQATARRWSRIA